jgi:hypothetical protein
MTLAAQRNVALRKHHLGWLACALLLGCSEGVVLIGEIRPRGDQPSPIPVSSPPPSIDARSAADAADAFVPESPPAPCATTQDVLTHILRPKCAVCHSGAPVSDKPDLANDDPRQGIINHRSACPGRALITFTEGYVGGHFFDKLAGPVAGCGASMPFGGIPLLSPSEVECLRAWFQPGRIP